ncbi:MAG: hypothetical protein QOD63_980 [Actinomycetota bacterium]|nr:hypothetical protein [Actinomycetota bacterium]
MTSVTDQATTTNHATGNHATGATEEGAQIKSEAEWLKAVLKVRSLLAVASSSPYEEEKAAYNNKAGRMATEFGIRPELLEFPEAPLEVVIVGAELRRLYRKMIAYEADPENRETKTAEWAGMILEYDKALEVAAYMLDVPVPRLPDGYKRRFRPEDQAHIEDLMAAAGYDIRGDGGWRQAVPLD